MLRDLPQRYDGDDERDTGLWCYDCGDGGAMTLRRPGGRVLTDLCQTCIDRRTLLDKQTRPPRAVFLKLARV